MLTFTESKEPSVDGSICLLSSVYIFLTMLNSLLGSALEWGNTRSALASGDSFSNRSVSRSVTVFISPMSAQK